MNQHSNLFTSFAAAIEQAVGVDPQIVQIAFPGAPEIDCIMDLKLNGRSFRLAIELKRSLFPRDAREAIWQIRNYVAHLPASAQPVLSVIFADSISPSARELLRKERVGYFDSSGSLSLQAQGLYVLVDKPAPRKQARLITNLFTGRRAHVLHAVWLVGRDWFGVHRIAERAGVSAATASETLISLERREWVEARGVGRSKERRLARPRELLDAWADFQAATKPRPVRLFYVPSTSPKDLQRSIAAECEAQGVSYELAGITAGQIHAPYLSSVSQVSCRVAAGSSLQAVLAAIGARAVREGWNLGVQEVDSSRDLQFRQMIDHQWVADPLQTYLDLLQAGGRAKELAAHLRAEKLDA